MEDLAITLRHFLDSMTGLVSYATELLFNTPLKYMWDRSGKSGSRMHFLKSTYNPMCSIGWEGDKRLSILLFPSQGAITVSRCVELQNKSRSDEQARSFAKIIKSTLNWRNVKESHCLLSMIWFKRIIAMNKWKR